MKKVLIIANLFYASPRIPGLVKYLPKFGWQPIILTPPLGENPDSRFGPPNDFKRKNRVVETHGYESNKDLGTRVRTRMTNRYKRVKPVLRFLYRRYSEIAEYPDKEKGWKSFALETARDLLQREDVDAIISSSSPVTTHLIAKELKDEHGMLWVADFRDLWTQNHNYPYTVLRRMFERRLELKTISTADALVTISEPLAEELKTLHKKRVFAITNGFDPEQIGNGKISLTTKLTITYTGQIYARQDPSKLLLALKDLISDGTINPNDVEVRFYGPENEQLEKDTNSYGLQKIVKQYGVVSRESSLDRQRESQLLFQINWEDPNKKGLYSGKIFEYLAAQRPIIATGDNDTIERLLNETDSGMYCPTVQETKKALTAAYSEYKTNGRVAYRGTLEKINKYSYLEMARKFTEILEPAGRRSSKK